MKIVIPGGSGHLGTILARAFHAQHEVVVLSRQPRVLPWRTVAWDGVNAGEWWGEIDGADVVINLAGQSVMCRYTPANRRAILRSRVDSTLAVGAAIAAVARPPHVWLQSSTATIYSHRFDQPNDEESGILGGSESGVPDSWRFSIDVAKSWERAFEDAQTPRTRKVAMRSAVVMSPHPGTAFNILLRLVRWGAGGQAGDGRQFVSWIHHHDFVRAVSFLIDRRFIYGSVNLASPDPVPNAELMRDLRQAWGISFGLPAPARLLELATFVHRTESELLLKSRYVVPGRLAQYGFRFEYSNWSEAAAALVDEYRTTHGGRRIAPHAQPIW